MIKSPERNRSGFKVLALHGPFAKDPNLNSDTAYVPLGLIP